MRCSHGLPLEVKCAYCVSEAMSKVMMYAPTVRKPKSPPKTSNLKLKTGFGK